MDPRLIDLDKLLVLVTVVDQGSFSAAARKLKRAQSAMSYAVQELEADLRLALFDRSGYRPELTEHGRALLPRARRLLADASAFAVQATGLRNGLESDLTVVVDSQFPMALLSAPFHAFQAEFPSVTTHVQVESVRASAAMLLASRADLGLVIAAFADPDQVEQRHAAWLDLVVVCAPGHPLAKQQAAGCQLAREDAADHLQLVLSDRSPDGGGEFFGVSAPRIWRLADLGVKHEMLRAGLGWGSLPRHLAADDLASGRLAELRLDDWTDAGPAPRIEAVLARRRDRSPGPAAGWLFDRLAATFSADDAAMRDALGATSVLDAPPGVTGSAA